MNRMKSRNIFIYEMSFFEMPFYDMSQRHIFNLRCQDEGTGKKDIFKIKYTARIHEQLGKETNLLYCKVCCQDAGTGKKGIDSSLMQGMLP